jgi:putative NADPH-quinone reductase
MRFLVVYCHPVPESFCAAIRDTVIEVIRAKGDEARLIDLYAERFDPVMSADERRSYNHQAPADADLAPHIERLKWAEAILFVYPTWWYGLPAMLKGWFDRVWATDVAFTLGKGGMITPLMTHIKKVGVITTCGAPWWLLFLMGQPGRKTILRGIRANCARRCKTMFLAHYLMDTSTPESRAHFLKQVRRKVGAF